MTHPTDTAKSEELKACPWGHEGIVKLEEPNHGRKGYCVCCFVCGSSPGAFDTPAEAIAAWNRRSSPPQNDAGVEGLREAIERFIADYDDGDRADAGTNPLMQAHIADLRAALRTPMSELQALGQEFEAGEKGRRETQAVWRCAIGDACAAVDVVKNRWLTSRRKHEREAGAELSKLADLLWSVRSPAAGNYDEASIAGKRLIGLVRSNLIPSAPSGEGNSYA